MGPKNSIKRKRELLQQQQQQQQQQGYPERQVKQEDQPLNLAHGDMWTPPHGLASSYFSQQGMAFNPALSQWFLGADNRLTNLEGRAGMEERSPEPKSRPTVNANERISMGHNFDWGYNRSQDAMPPHVVSSTPRHEFPSDSMDGESLSTAPDQDHHMSMNSSPAPSTSPAFSNVLRESPVQRQEHQLFQPQSQVLTKIHPK